MIKPFVWLIADMLLYLPVGYQFSWMHSITWQFILTLLWSQSDNKLKNLVQMAQKTPQNFICETASVGDSRTRSSITFGISYTQTFLDAELSPMCAVSDKKC